MIPTIDVSNYQDADLIRHFRQAVELGLGTPKHVIVRFPTNLEFSVSRAHARSQVQSARELGATVDPYTWTYRGARQEDAVGYIMRDFELCNLEPHIVWLDIEDYKGELPRVSDIYNHANALEARLLHPGIYTSKEMWRRIGNPTDLSDLPLWDANYGEALRFNVAYGGWTRAVGHQFAGSPLDLSYFMLEGVPGEITPDPSDPMNVEWEYLVNLLGYLQGDLANELRDTVVAADNELTWLYHKGRKAKDIKASVGTVKGYLAHLHERINKLQNEGK